MNSGLSPVNGSNIGEISDLIETLLRAERRLEELTGGEVDTVSGLDGRPFFLRRAQDQTRYREAARQAGILNALPEAIALLDTYGVILSANLAWKQFFQAREESIHPGGARSNYLQFCDDAYVGLSPGLDTFSISDGVQSVLAGQTPIFQTEICLDLIEGRRYFELTVTPLTQEGSSGAVVMQADITDRYRAKGALRSSENNLATAQAIAHFGSWEMDLLDLDEGGTEALRWSDEMFRIAGFEPGAVEVDTDLFFNLVHPDDRTAVRKAIATAVREHTGYSIQHRLIRPSGEVRYVREAGLIVFHERTNKPIKIVGTAHDVTEGRIAELALQASEREQRQLAGQLAIERARLLEAQSLAKIGSWEIELSTFEASWSEEAHSIFGTSSKTFLPTYGEILNFVHPEDRPRVHERFLQSLDQDLPCLIEHRLLLPDGTVKFVEERWHILRDEHRKPVRALGTCQDISERKWGEATLRRSEDRFTVVFEHAPIGMALKTINQRWLKVNQALSSILGYTEQEFVGQEFPDITHPDDLDLSRNGLRRLINREVGTVEIEKRYRHRLGHMVAVSLSMTLVRDDEGHPNYYIAQIQDITQRTKTETLLRNSQQRLLLATESARLGIWDWDVLSNRMNWDVRMLELYGLSEADFDSTYDAWQSGIHIDDRERASASAQAALRGTDKFDIEFRVVWPTGEVRHIEGHALVLRSEDGTPTRMIGVNWDITERKGAEHALRESEERFRKMLENVELLAVTLDTEGKVVFCNDYMLRVSGWDREEMLGSDWFSRFAADTDRSRRRDAFEDIQRKEIPTRVETQLLTKSGETRQVVWNVAVIRDASAQVIGTASIGEDVTERKNLQEQLLQSQKMESLGSLAGGIAHDFNNLLTGMLGYAELAQMKLSSDSPVQHDLEEICQSANRAATLTKQLLSFARKEVVEPKIVDLQSLVRGLKNLIQRLIGAGIDLQVRSGEDLGRVKLDPSQFEQVLVNLAVNARDAMVSGGSLTIDISNRTVHEVQDAQGNLIQPGRYVVITVTDTGAGMSRDVQSRVFDPFFTTKEKGKGTGLGLSTCYGIITNCGGKIWCSSEVGAGTTFHVYFPRVDEPLTPLEFRKGTETAGRGETVLVVDDENTVRTLAVTVLRAAGYFVLHASDGKAATGLFAECAEEIDLLVTDVVMPGMNGPALADVLRLLKPDLRVIFMSGFTDDAIGLNGEVIGESCFLQKPFSPAQLSMKVREALDQPL